MATKITLDEYSNGFTLKNAGNSICIINGDPLEPGESKAFGGNQGEIIIGVYNFKFQAIASPPPGYVQVDSAILTEKFYVPTPDQKQKPRC